MFPVYQVTNSSNKGRCPLSRYWAELCPGCVGEAQGEGLVIIISIIRAKKTEQIKGNQHHPLYCCIVGRPGICNL